MGHTGSHTVMLVRVHLLRVHPLQAHTLDMVAMVAILEATINHHQRIQRLLASPHSHLHLPSRRTVATVRTRATIRTPLPTSQPAGPHTCRRHTTNAASLHLFY